MKNKSLLLSIVAVFAVLIGASPSSLSALAASLPPSSATPSSTPSSTPSANCALDVYYVLDDSSSMSQLLANSDATRSKLQAAKDSITALNNILSTNVNNRVGLTYFYSTPTTQGSPDTILTPEMSALTTNFTTFASGLAAIPTHQLSANSGSPTASAVDAVKARFNTQWNRTNTPMIILLTDGVPTVDLAGWASTESDTAVVAMKDSLGNFVSSNTMRNTGPVNAISNRAAGYPIGDYMDKADLIKQIADTNGTQGTVRTFGVYLKGDNSVGTTPPDVLQYFALEGNGESYTANDLTGLNTSMQDTINLACQAQSASARLDITLPPSALLTPSQFKFGADTYNYNSTQVCFIKVGDSACSTKVLATKTIDPVDRIRISVVDILSGSGQLAYSNYTGAIANFVNKLTAKAYAPPPATTICIITGLCSSKNPWGFKLSFNSVTSTSVQNYINSWDGVDHGYGVKYSDGTCAAGVSGYLCLTSQVKLSAKGFTTVVQTLNQALSLNIPTLQIKGSAGAAVTLDGFVAQDGALILGGTISGRVSGGKQVSGYLSGSNFAWSNQITTAVLNTITQGQSQATLYHSSTGNYTNANWYLNATSDPTNPATTSYDSPPEGKLWNVDQSLTFTNPVTFSGNGTIIFSGNVTFNGAVNCSAGTRLGVITKTGNVVFNDNHISCGAFLALAAANGSQGTITFHSQQQTNVDANGIFIAQKNIVLPTLANGVTMTINYDNVFGKNPTILFRDILQTLLRTVS